MCDTLCDWVELYAIPRTTIYDGICFVMQITIVLKYMQSPQAAKITVLIEQPSKSTGDYQTIEQY